MHSEVLGGSNFDYTILCHPSLKNSLHDMTVRHLSKQYLDDFFTTEEQAD